jgi:hypothetical protein
MLSSRWIVRKYSNLISHQNIFFIKLYLSRDLTLNYRKFSTREKSSSFLVPPIPVLWWSKSLVECHFNALTHTHKVTTVISFLIFHVSKLFIKCLLTVFKYHVRHFSLSFSPFLYFVRFVTQVSPFFLSSFSISHYSTTTQ